MDREVVAGATLRNTPPLEFRGSRWARVLDVCDGDTVVAAMSLGGSAYAVRIRLAGIDAAEARAGGGRAAGRLAELLTGRAAGSRSETRAALEATPCVVRVECRGRDKYGRVLGDIMVPAVGGGESSAGAVLVSEGLAAEYPGRKRHAMSTTTSMTPDEV